jgi:hypothetical protein
MRHVTLAIIYTFRVVTLVLNLLVVCSTVNTEYWNAKGCDTFTHETHLVCFLQTGCTAGNPTRMELLHSVDDILAIAELETPADAIMMAQDEIACLDDMSLEGDIPDDVSDNGDDREIDIFTES